MEVEYDNLAGETLCFTHAVKAVMENNDKVIAHVPDNINTHDMGGTGYLGTSCCKCFPPTVDEDLEEEDEI